MNAWHFFPLAAALVLSPLMVGVVNRVKALFGGRTGKPLLQLYYDIFKLLGKGAVYSRTTTWVFRAGPVLGLAATLAATAMAPLGSLEAAWSFEGDMFVFVYFLAMGRFATMAAALDTGSSFEGMGASREAVFSSLAEPALFLGLLALARHAHSLSLTSMLADAAASPWYAQAPALGLVGVCLGILALSECSRIPFDDPNTHLELTMIHEVMVLDHSGPELALIEYGAALKLWILGALTMALLIPIHGPLTALAAMFGFAVAVGVVESSMARLRLLRVPSLLATAAASCALALTVIGS
ncbi:NADH-quinone oxidoreductase subunit H [Fundidesulfovibrio butyratiphilus]